MKILDSKIFFIFPGQGSQYRGMGMDLMEQFSCAREIFDQASEVVGYNMTELCFKDPKGQLNSTQFTQPALLTHQIACLESFKSESKGIVQPIVLAGHSVGEYSALVAGGALSFEAALRLVKHRGELMGKLGKGTMLATTLDFESAIKLADKHYCGIGGCNLPQQTVIAGEHDDLEALMDDLVQFYPGKRGIRLKTEGAFHTYLMVGAAQEFRKILDGVEFRDLETDVLSNYTGTFHEIDSAAIRSRLFFQLFNPVRWVDCMKAAMDKDVEIIVEFGGGIGKEEGPENKRPNLESITRKSLKMNQHEALYVPAINASSISSAAEKLT